MKVNIPGYKKNGLPRNAKIEIQDFDVWDMASTLAKVIHPMLLKFKEHDNHIHFDNDEIRNRSFDENDYDVKFWKEVEKRSPEIIDEMIWSFDQIARDYPDEPNLFDYVIGEKKKSEWLDIEGTDLVEYRNATQYDWDNYNPLVKAYNDRVQKGLDQFAYQYRGLWT